MVDLYLACVPSPELDGIGMVGMVIEVCHKVKEKQSELRLESCRCALWPFAWLEQAVFSSMRPEGLQLGASTTSGP